MTSANRNEQARNQNFKQVEADGWLSSYLPAISAGVVMTIVLLLAISCSHKSNPSSVKIDPPAPAAAASPVPAQTAAVMPEAPKKTKKRRPQNATYVNSVYGVAFSYPRKYSLEASNQHAAMPVEPGFLKPGAIEIASVDMPGNRYEETDFSSALLNVAVNPQVTAEECGRFKSGSVDPDAADPAAVKLGGNQFTELEVSGKKADRQSEVKYFHLFKNAACYEFALDVETARKPGATLAQLDREKVFAQLEKILASARIKDVELPGIEKVQEPSPSVIEPSAQILAPEHQ